MRVGERMHRDPIVARVNDTLGDARRLLARHGMRGIPIVRRSRFVGMVSEGEVAWAQPSAATTLTVGEIHGQLGRVRIERVLAADTTAVGRRTPLAEAIRLMRSRHVAALPVVSGHELIGVLTEEALLELLTVLLTPETSSRETEAAKHFGRPIGDTYY